MIGSCPECNEAIRIPEGKQEQRVRCPLCSAEFELSVVLEKLPPMLELVGGNPPEVGIQIDSGSDLDLVHAEAGESRASSGKTYRPQKRNQSSPMWEITKVVLGGALALPIGVLCVWWFAGRAPFGLSEKVSEYVPWIVPEKLRKGDSLNDSDLDSGESRPQANERNISSSKQEANRTLQGSNQGGGLGLTKSIEGSRLNGLGNSNGDSAGKSQKKEIGSASKDNPFGQSDPQREDQKKKLSADKQEATGPTAGKAKSDTPTSSKNSSLQKGKSKIDPKQKDADPGNLKIEKSNPSQEASNPSDPKMKTSKSKDGAAVEAGGKASKSPKVNSTTTGKRGKSSDQKSDQA